MPTTDDLLARTRDLLSEQGADFYGDDADLIPALNDGKRTLFSLLDALPELLDVTLAANHSDVIPDKRITRVSDVYADGQPLALIYAIEIPRKRLDASGTPTHYCVEFLGESGDPIIRLFPTPAASCHVTGAFYYEPPDLVRGDTDPTPDVVAVDPAWHKEFHFSVCYHAASVLLVSDNRMESAGLMAGRFAGEVARYQEWLNKRVDTRPTIVHSQPLSGVYQINR